MKTSKRIRRRNANKVKDADAAIIGMAREGAFERIGEEAIAETHKLGHSATVLLDGGIYKLHPDGTRTLLKAI